MVTEIDPMHIKIVYHADPRVAPDWPSLAPPRPPERPMHQDQGPDSGSVKPRDHASAEQGSGPGSGVSSSATASEPSHAQPAPRDVLAWSMSSRLTFFGACQVS